MNIVIFRNYKTKVVVLLFAVVIWFFVVTENEYEYVIEVPVTIINVPKGKVILNEIPITSKLKIQGNGKALIALSVGRGARVELDLSDVKHKKTFILGPKDVFLSRASGNIKIKEIVSPDSLSIILDDSQNKKIAVIPKFKVKTFPGYTIVGDIKLNPDSVVISGPKSIVSKINEIPTQEKEFHDLRFDLKETIPLAALPYQKVTTLTSQVEIFLDIQMLMERTINEVPVEVRHAPANMMVHVVPSTLSLVLEGGAELLSKVNRDDIIAYIDYKRVRNFVGNECPAYIETPPGVSYRDVNPKLFKLVLERQSSE